MSANEGSNRNYRIVGMNDGRHELSHHRNNAEKIAKIKKIGRSFADQFAAFLKKRKATKQEEQSLLDQSMTLYGCATGARRGCWAGQLLA
jgi:hypothetical protein